MTVYPFQERLNHANNVDVKLLDKVLQQFLPNALALHRAHESNDRIGIDYFLENHKGHIINVDMKVREKDFGKDDLALEIWQCQQKQIIGWSRDYRKQTDYVCWLFEDTSKICMLPFLPLVAVVNAYYKDWILDGHAPYVQITPLENGDSLYSECIFVPRRKIWAKIYEYFNKGL